MSLVVYRKNKSSAVETLQRTIIRKPLSPLTTRILEGYMEKVVKHNLLQDMTESFFWIIEPISISRLWGPLMVKTLNKNSCEIPRSGVQARFSKEEDSIAFQLSSAATLAKALGFKGQDHVVVLLHTSFQFSIDGVCGPQLDSLHDSQFPVPVTPLLTLRLSISFLDLRSKCRQTQTMSIQVDGVNTDLPPSAVEDCVYDSLKVNTEASRTVRALIEKSVKDFLS